MLMSNGTDNYSSLLPSIFPDPLLSSSPRPSPSYFLSDLNDSSSTYQHTLSSNLLLQFSKPIVNSFKAFGIGQIEHQQSYLCVSIIKGHDRSKSLISSCIPNIQLNLLPCLCFYFLLLISTCQGRLVHLLENSFLVSHCNRSFANCCITTKH